MTNRRLTTLYRQLDPSTRRVIWIAASCSLLLFSWYVYPRMFDRTYVLSVSTAGVEVEFSRSLTNSWYVSEVTYCERRQERLKGNPAPSQMCDSTLFAERPISDVDILFEKEAHTTIAATPEMNGLLITVHNDNEDGALWLNGDAVPAGSLLFVSKDAWAEAGSLEFTGKVTIGEVASSGETRLVSGGTYEIRERTFPGSSHTVTTKSGRFFRGDQIRIVDRSEEQSVDVKGFLVPDGSEMAVQAASPDGNNFLRIDRLGSGHSIISTSAMDRTRNDPAILFLSLLATVILTLSQLFSAVTPSPKKAEEPKKVPRE